MPQPKQNVESLTTRTSSTVSTILPTLHSQQHLQEFVQAHDTVIIEFLASWCSNCKGIATLYEDLAEASTQLKAGQVVCDTKNKETKKLATAFGVKSYPVFILFENGTESARWNGADRGKLERAFDQKKKKKKRGRR